MTKTFTRGKVVEGQAVCYKSPRTGVEYVIMAPNLDALEALLTKGEFDMFTTFRPRETVHVQMEHTPMPGEGRKRTPKEIAEDLLLG